MTTDKLKTLLDKRAKAWAEVVDYRQRAEENQRLTPDQQRAWNESLDEVERLDGLIKCEEREGNGLTPASPPAAPGVAVPESRDWFADGRPLPENRSMVDWLRHRDDQPTPAEHEHLDFGKAVRGIVTGDWRDADAERRAMAEGTLSAGGYAVPTMLSAEVIDLARNRARVLQSGGRVFPMASQTVNVAKWASDPEAGWRSENASISEDDATLGSVQLEAKSLAVLVKASRELLEDAHNIGQELQNAFAASIALEFDKAALYGSGTDPEPQGVKGTTGITTQELGSGDGDTPDDFSFLVKAVGALQDNNEEATAAILAPRTERLIAGFHDTTNQPLRPPAMVADLPRRVTNQVPTDLTVGTSTDTSDVFVADFRQLLLGVRTQLIITPLIERYADTGQVGFVAWFRGDIAVARPKAFTVVTGVTAS